MLASNAHEELREFATKTGIPVAMTVHGLGSIPSDHYLSLNMLGMHGTIYANYAVNDADLLLALGVRFDDRVTGKLTEFAKHGRIVHVEIDASEINKNKYAHIPVHADVKAFLEAINPLVGPGNWRAWHQQIDEWRTAEPMTYDQRDDVILPQYVLEQFSKLTKGEFLMSTGVGQHQMWAAQWTQFKHPRTWITSGGLGSMGYGLPAAMGAQAAFPEALVVDIDGDGSFLMNIQELATLYCEKLPVKVIILNNQHLGMVVQWEDRFHAGQSGSYLPGTSAPPRSHRPGRGGSPRLHLPRLRRDLPGLRHRGPADPRKVGGVGSPRRDDRSPRSLRPGCADSLPGARSAHDPLGWNRARHHQELTAGGRAARERQVWSCSGRAVPINL